MGSSVTERNGRTEVGPLNLRLIDNLNDPVR
jgi:hypothetical protein